MLVYQRVTWSKCFVRPDFCWSISTTSRRGVTGLTSIRPHGAARGSSLLILWNAATTSPGGLRLSTGATVRCCTWGPAPAYDSGRCASGCASAHQTGCFLKALRACWVSISRLTWRWGIFSTRLMRSTSGPRFPLQTCRGSQTSRKKWAEKGTISKGNYRKISLFYLTSYSELL